MANSVLSAGSIAFTGFNSDNTISASFNFVTLSDINSGQVITFTDNNHYDGSFGSVETTWTWTASQDIAAGTVITLDNLINPAFDTSQSATSNLGTVVSQYSSDTGFQNEVIFAYTGTQDNPTFLAALSTWDFPDMDHILSGTGLESDVSAITLGAGGNTVAIAQYNGPTSGFSTFEDYRTALNNPANWIQQPYDYSGNNPSHDGTPPDAPLPTPPFTVDPTVQTVSFAEGSRVVSVAEGQPGDSNVLTFTITRSGSTTGDLNVHGSLVFGPDSGVDASDFGGTLPTFSGIIAAGQSSVTISIAVSADIKAEADESFQVKLDSATNPNSPVVIGPSSVATGIIANDDAPQTVRFADESQYVEVTEGDSGHQTITFTVVREGGGTLGDLHFTVQYQHGIANADDFGGTQPGTIEGVILDGQTSATFTIDVTGDVRYENDDYFSLALVSASNDPVGAVVAPSYAGGASTVVILNDDPQPTTVATGETAEGQITVTGHDHFTIEAGGVLSYVGQAAMLWTGTDTAPVIDNFGQISGASHALEVNSHVTGNLIINNHEGASIADELSFTGLKTGQTVTINNEGVLGGNEGSYAVEMSESGGVVILNNLATGVITQFNAGSDVLKNGSNGTINNWGKIASPADTMLDDIGMIYGGDGWDMGGAGNTVHNYAGGLFEGSRHAVTGSASATIINEAGGTMIGRNGSAANFDNDADPANALHVTNHGTMIGASEAYGDSDGDAIDADGLAFVDNDGLIKGIGASGYHKGEANVSEGLAIGGGVINNYVGGEIYGYGRAIQVDNSSNGPALAATTIYNEGLIQGDGHGPEEVDPADAAVMQARIDHREAIDILGNFADTITNKGQIVGGVFTDGGDDTFIAYAGSSTSGLIDGGTGNDKIVLTGTGLGMLGTNQNFETLDVESGTWLIQSAAYSDVTVAAGAVVASQIKLANSGEMAVANGAVVAATSGDAVVVEGSADIENAGVIIGAAANAIVTNGGTVHNAAGGFIQGLTAAIASGDAATAGLEIINEGLIQSALGRAIVLGGQNDTLTNKAQIMGDVSMGGGDDTLNVYTGSTISGAIDLGGGNDTVHLLGAGDSFGAVANAENLDVDRGIWTVATAGTYDAVTIAAGATLANTIVVTESIVVTVGGTLAPASGRGIDAKNGLSNGSTLSVDVLQGGQIIAGDDAIRVNKSFNNGFVTIDNAGLIKATGGQAIDLTEVTSKTTQITITNEITGVLMAVDADAVRGGGNSVIENYGQIISVSTGDDVNDGIDFQDDGAGTVTNHTGGSIIGAHHGITGKHGITVVNELGGTIIGGSGSAVNIDNDADVANTVNVTNYGLMLGNANTSQEDSDGDAIDVDGLLKLDNYGFVSGTGANGYHEGEVNVSEGIAAGGGTINNYAGATIYGYGRAIQIDDSNNGGAFASTVIYNEGTIQGDGHGPEGADVTDVDKAAMQAKIDGREAIDILGTFADTITNKGQIIGGVFTDGGDDTFNAYVGSSSGKIDLGDGNDTIHLLGTGTGSLGAIANVENLDVDAGTWALASIAGVSNIDIASGATVTSALTLTGNLHLTIEQGGALSTSGIPITWGGANSAPVIDNYGLIQSAGTQSISPNGTQSGTLTINNYTTGQMLDGINFNGISTGTNVILNNDGLIQGDANFALRIARSGGATATVNNSATGVITSTTAKADVISWASGTTINNSGKIISLADTANDSGGSAIDFNSGRGNTVHNMAGGLIEGSHHAVTGKDVGSTIINDAGATLVGRNGSGVNIDNAAGVANTVFVTNRGDILGKSANYADSDGDAVDVDGLLQIDNYGNIKGLGANGYHGGVGADFANVSEGIAIGGGTINNYAGATIYGYGRAIQVDNSSNGAAPGAVTIYNEGTIQGDGHGPTGVSDADAAAMQAKINGREAIDVLGTFADTITNKGTIIGGIFTDGGDDVFNAYVGSSSGKIDLGDGNDTANLYATSGNTAIGTAGQFVNVETLNVVSGSWKLGFGFAGANINVKNGATITSGTAATAMGLTGGQTLTVDQGGLVQGTKVAIGISGGNIDAIVNNSGTINVSSRAGTDKADAISLNGGTATIHNTSTGLIEGARHAITGPISIHVINDAGGLIVGDNGSAVNMDNSETEDHAAFVTNYGTMLGKSANISDSDGDAIDVDGLLHLNNYGLIQGLGANGYHKGEANVSEGVAIGGGTINNFAGGTIYGYGRAIQVHNSSNAAAFASATIYNEGTIQGGGHGPTSVADADAAVMQARINGGEAIDILGSFADTITNTATGKIIGGIFTDGGNDTLTNAGSITAMAGSAVNMGDGNDTVTNTGTITGTVLLGAGDDTFNEYVGSTSGQIDGGDGNDTVNLYTAAGNTALGTTGQITNVETLNVESGNWHIGSGFAGANINVAGGAAIINGTSGILSLNSGQTLTVEEGGLVQGTKNAVFTGTGDGDVFINNSGTINVTSVPGTKADAITLNGATATIHNTSTGVIEGARHAITGPRGIHVINDEGGLIKGDNGSAVNMDSGPSEDSAAFVTNHGTMLGDSATIDDSDGDAIDVDGLLHLDNYGVIRGEGANGYHKGEANVSEGLAIGGGTVHNYEGGQIYGYGRAIQVDNSSNAAAFAATTIINDGTIQGGGNGPTGVSSADTAAMQARINGAEAIDILGSFADTITNTATGKIIGGIFTDGGNDVLTNAGSITAMAGSAVNLGDGDDTLSNSGAIIGTVLLGAGNDTFNDYVGSSSGAVDGGAGTDTVNAYATAGSTATGVVGQTTNVENLNIVSGNWALSNGFGGTNIDVGNGAALVGGMSLTGGQTLTVEEGGLVQGLKTAIFISGGNVDANILNSGTINVTSNAGTDKADAISLNGATATIHNTSTGDIEGARHAITGPIGVHVINDAGGLIVGHNGSAVNMDNSATEDHAAFVTNYGTMLGQSANISDSDGDAIDVDGLLHLDNYGVIRGEGANGYHKGEANVSEGLAIGGGTVHNYEGGEIYGYGRAIQVDDSSNGPALGATTIINDGTIQGDGHGPTGVDPTVAAAMQAKIDGREAIDILGTFNDSITNTATGKIIGGIFTDGGNDTLTNTGTITGTVDMGAGNDTVVLGDGSSVSGTIFLGAGDDTLTASASAGGVTVYAGAGNDTVTGGGGNDVFHGDIGNDTLAGGGGSDTYDYDQGDGLDTIVEAAGQAGDVDSLVLVDIDPAGAVLYKHGNDLDIILQDGGKIVVTDQFAGGGIENISFGDGTVLDHDGIAGALTDRGPVVTDVTLPTVQEDATSFVVSFDTLLAGASDADLDLLSIKGIGDFVGGTAVLTADGVQFTLDPNYNGEASLSFTVDDGRGGTATAHASFDVTPVNDAPVVTSPSTAVTDEDTPLRGQIVATDVDGDTVTYALKGDGAAHGTVNVDTHGNWTYTPGANYNGSDSFIVSVSDGHTTVDTTVNLTVNPVNDLPQTVADHATVGEHDTASFNLTANDTDVEDGMPHLSGFSVTDVDGINLSNAAAASAFHIVNGQLQFDGGDLFGSLNDGDHATVTINYTAEDNNGGHSTGEFVLTVNGVTDLNPIEGSNGSDILYDTCGNDHISGGDGNDNIFTVSGSDLVDAGNGNDYVFATSGNATVNGGEGNDYLFGGSGNTVLNGDNGNDTIIGGSGNEVIKGGAGNDTLMGNAGNDVLAGGQGTDQLFGGTGSDTFVFKPGDGKDTVFDFQASGPSHDVIELDSHTFADFNALMQSGAVHDAAGGAQIDYADGSSLMLMGVTKASLKVDDFHFA